MHASFEDTSAKEGSIGRFNAEGELIWERPRTRRETDIEPWSTLAALSLALAFPLAFCVAFWLFG